MTNWLRNPALMTSIHGWLTVIWFALTIGTTVAAFFIPDNRFLLAWIIFMSGYANAASHWGAKEAAGAESNSDPKQST